MNPSPSQRCPECWTAYDRQPELCPACGHRLGKRRKPWLTILVSVGVIAAATGLGIRLWGSTPAADTEDTADPATVATGEPAPRDTPAPPPAPASSTGAVWRLTPTSVRDEAVTALVLRAPAGAEPQAYLFLPVDDFPLHGSLQRTDGTELRFGVVNWNQGQGYVLLSLDEPVPAGLTPASARGSGRQSVQLQVPGDPRPLAASGLQSGKLVLERDTPAGAALLDADGQVAGLTLGGTRALPLDAVIPWLGQPGRRGLVELQRELRATHPELVIEEVSALLVSPTAARTGRALEMLDETLGLVQDREALLELEQLRGTAAQLHVRELNRTDPAGALTEARRQLARHATHLGLLGDTVLLTVQLGDPQEALGLYDRLVALSPDRARDLAESAANGLAQTIRRRWRGRRYQEAIELAAASLLRFGDRADLHMLHAQALWDAGRHQEALGAGQIASQLDPAHQAVVSGWQATVARDRDPDTVAIPYDPTTNVITTWVSIDGQSMEFLIDTGASLTTIPTAVAQRLSLVKPDSPVVVVETANGRVEGRRVRVANLAIGSISLRGVQVVVLDLPGELQGKGLLGLNVLQPLNMTIDSTNRVLILKRPARRRRRPR